MESTSILMTEAAAMGINKRPYPTEPVDTSMPKRAKKNPYRWRRGLRAEAYTESQVKMATPEEIEADFRAIYGPEMLELELGVQRLTIVSFDIVKKPPNRILFLPSRLWFNLCI
jgi:hypothetical protein